MRLLLFLIIVFQFLIVSKLSGGGVRQSPLSPDFVNGTPKSVGRWYQRGEQALLGSSEQGLRGCRAIG